MWTTLALAAFCFHVAVPQAPNAPILGREFWEKDGEKDLNDALKVKLNTGVAKNVIIFIGDGMSANTVVAARIYNGGETSKLAWEKFEHVGLLKTYCNDKTVPDSSVTASAIMSGIKGNKGTMGTDETVKKADCKASLNPSSRTVSNALHAQAAGKATGIVTNTRVTHATPGAVYASSADRDWECDGNMPETAKDCKDIARQLIEDEPGRSFNVIMGGGRQGLVSGQQAYPDDPIDMGSCRRNDSRNLINEWIDRREREASKFVFVNNTGGLRNLDTSNTDYLLGIFANSHMAFNYQRDESDSGQPSLEMMTTTAVKVLNNNPNGFFLMVEGGKIDLGHHKARAKVALDETVQLHKAVGATVRLLEELKIKDETLLIVTSDHGHTLSINGYPDRGSSILGIADKSKREGGANFTTLMYSVAGEQSYQYSIVNGQVHRRDPSLDDTESWDYRQQAAVLNDENKHDGGDVNVYATGPMAHLFHNVHEQSYVAHVILYAARLGRYNKQPIASSSTNWTPCSLLILAILGVVCSRDL